MDFSEDQSRRATNKCILGGDGSVHIEPITAHSEYENTVHSRPPRMILRNDILHFDGNDSDDDSDCSDGPSDRDGILRLIMEARKEQQKAKKLWASLAAAEENEKKKLDHIPEGFSNAESTESPELLTLCPRLGRVLNGLFSKSPKIADDLFQQFIASNHEDSHFPTSKKAFHADCASFGYELSETQLSRFEQLQRIEFADEEGQIEQNSDQSVPDEIGEFLSGAVNVVKGVVMPALMNAGRRLQETMRDCELL